MANQLTLGASSGYEIYLDEDGALQTNTERTFTIRVYDKYDRDYDNTYKSEDVFLEEIREILSMTPREVLKYIKKNFNKFEDLCEDTFSSLSAFGKQASWEDGELKWYEESSLQLRS